MIRINRFIYTLPLIVLAGALASCASPTMNTELQKAQAAFASAKMDPDVVRRAPLGLQTAESSLKTAEGLWNANAEPAEVNHHAYLALQRTAIAREMTNQKIAEEKIEDASNERNKVLLEARTTEADLANIRAKKSAKDAELAREQTDAQIALLATKTADAEAAEERARLLEAEVAKLEAIKTERGLVITLGDVFFDTGKAELKGGAVVAVNRIADFMKTYPTRNLMVEGFTDSRGSDAYNLDLSERRASSLRSALIASGVGPERVTQRGYGESFPVASNETAEGRQLNRRVEIIISDEEGRITERR